MGNGIAVDALIVGNLWECNIPGWSQPGLIRLLIYVVFVSGKAPAAGESTAILVLLPAAGALPLTKSTIG